MQTIEVSQHVAEFIQSQLRPNETSNDVLARMLPIRTKEPAFVSYAVDSFLKAPVMNGTEVVDGTIDNKSFESLGIKRKWAPVMMFVIKYALTKTKCREADVRRILGGKIIDGQPSEHYRTYIEELDASMRYIESRDVVKVIGSIAELAGIDISITYKFTFGDNIPHRQLVHKCA